MGTLQMVTGAGIIQIHGVTVYGRLRTNKTGGSVHRIIKIITDKVKIVRGINDYLKSVDEVKIT